MHAPISPAGETSSEWIESCQRLPHHAHDKGLGLLVCTLPLWNETARIPTGSYPATEWRQEMKCGKEVAGWAGHGHACRFHPRIVIIRFLG